MGSRTWISQAIRYSANTVITDFFLQIVIFEQKTWENSAMFLEILTFVCFSAVNSTTFSFFGKN
jgi:hypothetical protein